MNPSFPPDLASLATRLQHQHAELTAQLRRRLASAQPLASLLLAGNASLDDPAVIRQLPRCDLTRLADELFALRSLDAACARLADGSYGRCLSCGEPIAPERLRVQPTAQNCLSCQTAHEQRLPTAGTRYQPS
ncbi:TraR/DksA family transcriptional regulator [Duganella sp. S19_KUP01_CR8]|uniref:TraR/DksA family transcriptional regulator n=1 Tax=Duganella sp. S19_KUP01_CR8 TaxID=3025502 RepID=UPI002FCD76BD